MLKIFNKHNNDKGAASVLVVVMMLVLVVFGLAMTTTALAQYRLSENHEQFVDDHFTLETEAQNKIAAMDQVLLEAERQAVAYLVDLQIADPSYDGGVLNHLDYYDDFDYYEGDERQAYLNEVFPMIYKDLYDQALNDIIEGDEAMTIEYMAGDDLASIPMVRISIASEGSTYQKFLNVEMELMTPAYDFTYENDTIKGIRQDDAPRYQIVTYQQEQIAFSYDETIKFENPFEKPE